MNLKYLIIAFSVFSIVACNKEKENDITNESLKSNKKSTSKQSNTDETIPFLQQQLAKMNYQQEAFKIGKERLVDLSVKDYINSQDSEIKNLIKDYETMFLEKSGSSYKDANIYKNELYKLSIADAKDFDNIFIKYYKEFLSTSVNELGAMKLHNEELNGLKNAYGNLLYDQNLFFSIK